MATTSELDSDLQDTADWGRKGLVDFIAGKTWFVLFDRSGNSGATDMKMGGPSFKILGLFFSSLLDWALGVSPGQKKVVLFPEVGCVKIFHPPT